MFGLVFVFHIVRRIGEAARMLYRLTFDRDRSRRLPWTYIRSRARRDPVVVLALFTILGCLVALPLAVILGNTLGQGNRAYLVPYWIWLASVTIAPLISWGVRVRTKV